jgi:hypothetical protein
MISMVCKVSFLVLPLSLLVLDVWMMHLMKLT